MRAFEPVCGDPVGEAAQRVDLGVRRERRPRAEGERRVVAAFPAPLDHDGPGRLVEAHERCAALGERLVHPARPELVLLLGEAQRPHPGRADLVAPDDLEPRDRLAILVAELFERPLAAREQRPEDGLGLAAVIADEVEGRADRPLALVVLGLVVEQPRGQPVPERVGAGLQGGGLAPRGFGGSGASVASVAPNRASTSGRRASSHS